MKMTTQTKAPFQMVGETQLTLISESTNPELFKRVFHKNSVISIQVTIFTSEGEAHTLEAYANDLEWETHDIETGELVEVE
jgi:hypothetical protein